MRGGGVLAVGAALYGGCWAIRRPYSDGGIQSAVAEKQADARLEALRASLAKEPCDRNKIVELGEGLMQAGEPREAIDRSTSFFGKCGEYPRLRWVTYAAHQRLGEWEPAVADASKLIESEPESKDYWWWRGIVYEKHGELEKAASDYRQSMLIEPAITNIPINLADVYERLGRPCEAIQPLEQLVHEHPKQAGQVDARIRRLSELPACKALAATGSTTMRFPPGAKVIQAKTKIAGVPAKMIVDTGATYVAIGPRLATKLKIDSSNWPEVMMQSAVGTHKAKIGWVDSIVLDGVRADHVEAVLLPDDLLDADGLLGLSFLSRFAMRIDHGKGELELQPR